MVEISIRRIDPELPLPAYAHPGDAGADLCSAVDVTLAPGARALVPTGIAMALPEGYVALVHPRSGLAARHGISIVNAPGTIDAGYRGEVQVCLVNTDRDEPFEVRRGDRIAQLVIQRFESAAFVEAEDLPESARGAGGYGSTGGFATGPGEPAGSADTETTRHPERTGAGGTAR
jgi:dUTP pyrophosphatase